MAAVVHGCGSPRQHHGSNISCASLAGSHHKHPSTTPIYPTMPKYTRSSTTVQQLSTPSHHHVPGHQYNPPLPPVTYLPMAGVGAAPSHSYATTTRPTTAPSAAAAVAECRNYWPSAHTHAATMMYRSDRHHKRKSAVELLAETKPFYIKSDAVFERLQQSNYRTTNIGGSSGNKRGRNSLDGRDDRCKPSYGDEMEHRYATPTQMRSGNRGAGSHMHAHHHHHGHHGTHMGHHSVGSNNSLLQSKLRMFLGADASRDRIAAGTRTYRNELPRKFDYGPKVLNKEPLVFTNEDDADIRMPPPPSFLSPQSFENAYNYDTSSGEEPLVLTENYRPISPPAEYAAGSSKTNNEQRSRYNYQRSYSHSNEIAAENAKYAATAYNINSHKSLPDLHSQISRHSPHSEILSSCSRGNRSIKSAGESSLNRDSGGSSGHYTHRSEPCYRQPRDNDREAYAGAKNCCNASITPMEYRRDSGSSTQHSANSYCGGGYASPSYSRTADCAECHCNNKSSLRFDSSDYLLNFTTPEVPEAFQDDYTPPSPTVPKYKSSEPRCSNSSSQLYGSAATYASELKSQSSLVQSPGSAPSMEDISPPPIQFKRQRCIRFKNRNRISLPSLAQQTSIVNESNDSYNHRVEQQVFFPKGFSADAYPREGKSYNDASSTEIAPYSFDADHGREADGDLDDLEKFFDRLGLNDDMFHEIYSAPRRRRSAASDSDDSSTVFFSDVSTVDSMRLPDSTETQPQTTQPYRPSEPPSIVERNARIVKWLVNMRKLE